MKRLNPILAGANNPRRYFLTPSVALVVLAGLIVGTLTFSPVVEASSHRDSPFISEDPAADNTDVHAVVNTETGRDDADTRSAGFDRTEVTPRTVDYPVLIADATAALARSYT